MEACGGTHGHAHPFINEVNMSTLLRIRGLILGCILFPVRMTLSTLFFLLMWPVARLRLAGLSAEERAAPVRGWRRWLFQPVMVFLSRSVFFSVGFHWIKVKGRQASQEEAPVLAVAPHSGFLDMLVLPVSGLPIVVSRVENSKLPVIGALLDFNQAVLVSRKDPESRKECVSQIKDRLTSKGSWPQMLMFPEGTTTNGHALIKFKPGAFLAGVPVQPVLLHYPNRTDTVRWTWKGTSWLDCLWYTSSQIYSNVTVEYLPVYTPSEEEKLNPELYADNVQKLMAKSLGVPATDYVMEGLIPVTKLGGLSLPLESPAKETLALLQHHGTELEEMMNRMTERCSSGLSSSITTEELRSLLQLSPHTALKICSLYSKSDRMDVRQLCLSVCTASGLRPLQALLHTAFSLYDSDGDGLLSADELSGLMGALLGVPQYHITEMYSQLIRSGEPTEGALYDLLTTHPTYRKLFGEYFHQDRARHVTADRNHNGIPNEKTSTCGRGQVLNGGGGVREKVD